jgi:flagellar hook-length control protein FliK
MLRVIHARLGQQHSVATMRLDPPELGMVRLHMDLRADQLALTIETARPEARRLLHEQLDALRQGLESSGIQLSRVELRTVEMAASDLDAQTSQEADVGAGDQEASHSSDDGAASREEQAPGTEASSAEPTDTSRSVAAQESATESLVNVLA